ncbi:MAG: CBS domain-containing protein [Candidatus Neomarinimicrobiota bacterium]
MAIGSIMTTEVVTVDPDASLKTIKEIFDHVKFHHLLVVENKRLFGVISDRDLLKALSPWLGTLDELPRDRAILSRRAHQICSRRPITATRETSVADAARILLDNNVSCLPVISREGGIEGIVTWKDIFKTYFKNSGPEHSEIRD